MLRLRADHRGYRQRSGGSPAVPEPAPTVVDPRRLQTHPKPCPNGSVAARSDRPDARHVRGSLYLPPAGSTLHRGDDGPPVPRNPASTRP